MTDYDDLPFKIERWSKGYGRPEETRPPICVQPKPHSKLR
jgi:hypothetical protein